MSKFKLNELVWAKYDLYPWWPAVIKRESDEHSYEILFCGDDAKAIIPKKQIAKWEKNFDIFTSKIQDKDLLFSIGIALKLQEGIFDFKDHVDFIRKSNKDEIVTEMVEFLNFNQSQIDNLSKPKNSNTFLKRKRALDSDLLSSNKQPKRSVSLFDNVLRSLSTHVDELKKSFSIINELKGRISSKLSKCSKDTVVIHPDNISSLSNLLTLTSNNDKNDNELISPYLKCFQFKTKRNDPSSLYTNILNIKNCYNKERYDNEIRKYEKIHLLYCDILSNLKYKEVQGRDVNANLPSLEIFIDCMKNNKHVMYQGFMFNRIELTNKYTKFHLRKKVRDGMKEILFSMFNYIEMSFIDVMVGGIDTLCFKMDKQVTSEYIYNINAVMNVINAFIFKNRNEMMQERVYDLSLDF